jgi:ribonuclease BN (tRNA processing enzyme)
MSAEEKMNITFWGVRGSRIHLPHGRMNEFSTFAPGTSCVEVQIGPQVAVFEAGLASYENFSASYYERLKAGTVRPEIKIYASHGHTDHIYGLEQPPIMFDPSVIKTIRIADWAGSAHEVVRNMRSEDVYNRAFNRPVSPDIAKFHKSTRVLELKPGRVFLPRWDGGNGTEDITIRTTPLKHGDILCAGFAVTHRDKATGKERKVCLLTDMENNMDGNGQLTPPKDLLGFIDGASVMVADGMFTQADFNERPFLATYGHATGEYIGALGREAGVGKTVVTHHNPVLTDTQLLDREAALQKRFPNLFFARTEMRLEI